MSGFSTELDEALYREIVRRLEQDYKLERRLLSHERERERQRRLEVLTGKKMPRLEPMETD